MINPLDIIRKYYTLDSLAGQSLLIHSQLVRDKAQSLAIRHPEMDLDIPFIQEAAPRHRDFSHEGPGHRLFRRTSLHLPRLSGSRSTPRGRPSPPCSSM